VPVTTHVDDAAPLPVVSSGAQDDQRRGGRSRHDHSRSHKATSKFGDFILGNTIGEGEFGKVKLGWKQDSNVQVSSAKEGIFKSIALTTSFAGCHQAN
jgi:protein-serine/threonine kinase